ncbi:hypothetical protein A1O1_05930 [Capronia coronata CBS 617.96]|uniref:Uncharacterized protein n=1 Tax=Capronia coronata CBS 617.96 TaxID=1182541 RepID=W9Y8J9_9EURO|nr:uncharacterized protein A1O1_05930 [Capronia coronata CBS 617.96]EXJ85566.1 hypothetical protein A1O1_05930 [Capronia coronata CBS 617.96]
MTVTRRPLSPTTAYTLAHTAQCKLKLAANRPDRNLRFVLGHAFTLDNLMLRIVEIENHSAGSAFQEANKASSKHADENYDCTAAAHPHHDHHDSSQGHEHYDCTQVGPTPAEPEPEAEPEPSSGRGRSISFRDNNARPSSTAGVGSNNGLTSNSPGRKRSPPPTSISAVDHTYLDDDGSGDTTSSDDYDDPETIQYNYDSGGAAAASAAEESEEAQHPKHRPVHDPYSDEEDAALELADDELETEGDDGGFADEDADEEEGLGLQRFASAADQPPRMIRSTSSSSSSEEEDPNEPVSPPQLPSDIDVKELVQGEQDDELTDLYESVRRCRCHGQRDRAGGAASGVWDVPVEKTGGKRFAVVAVAA